MSYRNIYPHPFHKSIVVPTSKSYANRFLILASLKKKDITINNISYSNDVLDLIRCLKSVGLDIQKKGKNVRITNSFPGCETNGHRVIHLDTGEGGTTNRFLIPFLSLGKRTYVLHMGPSMENRPMEEIITPLKNLGVKVEFKNGYFQLQGPVKKVDNIIVDCSRSTQFASGLFLSMDKHSLDIIPQNIKSSHSYLELTKKLLDRVKLSSILEVPLDFSSMSYPLALAATCGRVCIKNYTGPDPYQGDSYILDVLKKMNAHIVEEYSLLKVSRSPLTGVTLDCSRCLDIVPTLIYLCSYANGKSILKNINALRYKESNRILNIKYLLELFRIPYKLKSNSIEILGPGKKRREYINVFPSKDHRIVMASYLFLRHNSGGRLYRPESVEKSFPYFFNVME